MDEPLYVLGSGSLGIILSTLLAEKAPVVTLCWHDAEEAARIRRSGSTQLLDQVFFFPDNIEITTRNTYLQDNFILFVAVSSRELEETMESMLAALKDKVGTVVLFTKGVPSYTARKKHSANTFCDYMEKYALEHGITRVNFAAVNGPALLSELFHSSYSFLNVGCANLEAGKRVAEILASDRIYCEHTSDVIGVEMCGVLKNPIAIACGIASAMKEVGGNFMGELIHRGFREMLSLSLALGARQETIIGRSGIADLATTCMSPESRNRAYGERFMKRLLAGEDDPGILDKLETFLTPERVIQKDVLHTKDVVEGGFAISSIVELGEELQIEIPIYRAVYEILSRRSPPTALISAVIGAPVRDQETPVIKRRQGLHLASGTDFVEVLSERVFHNVHHTKGMQARIKKQSGHVLQQLEKRLGKARATKNKMDLEKLPRERDLWTGLSSAFAEEEGKALKDLIQFYASEIADSYTPGMRETLIRLLAPVRFAASGFRFGSALPRIGGYVDDLKELAARYNIMYAPTHRSHLDSVEVAFGLSWLSLPLPRYAAGINLMTDAFQSWLLRSFGAYAVDRERTRNFLYLECLSSYATVMLESGIPSLMYPEGTRSRTGGIVQIKTGLLSTAVDAFRNTGREVVVVPLALSYESVPEDAFYCDLEPEPPFKDFINKRGSAYLDVCHPIRVSQHMNSDDPTHSIALNIADEWRKHLRVLPNHVIARLLADGGHSLDLATLPGKVEAFVAHQTANFLTRETKEIVEQGVQSLIKRGIARRENGNLVSARPALTAYYGSMIPDSPVAR
ncbi:MAG: 1-acyl-sn-glycerol-3-phosphate acyltransferase [Spirochaetia bacterium]|nr:1-acyl-sn-glycerol-3-phosphate acyltransferase [Spirochaetia bacterium]